MGCALCVSCEGELYIRMYITVYSALGGSALVSESYDSYSQDSPREGTLQ